MVFTHNGYQPCDFKKISTAIAVPDVGLFSSGNPSLVSSGQPQGNRCFCCCLAN